MVRKRVKRQTYGHAERQEKTGHNENVRSDVTVCMSGFLIYSQPD